MILINGCEALLAYLKEKCKGATIQEIPEDLTNLANQINGVGPKGIERFVKQLEELQKGDLLVQENVKSRLWWLIDAKKRLGRRPSYMEIYQQGDW